MKKRHVAVVARASRGDALIATETPKTPTHVNSKRSNVSVLGTITYMRNEINESAHVLAGSNTTTLEGHTDLVTCVAALGHSGAISGSNDKTLRIWDISDGKCCQTLVGHQHCVCGVVLADPGKVGIFHDR